MRITSLLFASILVVTASFLHADEILIKNGQTIDITVMPAGVGGHKSDQILARLDKNLLSKNLIG